MNQNRIKQLGEVIRVMKRTENALDSKLVLSVIERYNEALELLDAYDHQTLTRPKGKDGECCYELYEMIIKKMAYKSYSHIIL